jgi:hypothetical protein
MLLYVSGKYSGDIDANIETAMVIAAELWIKGHAVICPHANTAHFERRGLSLTYEDYIAGDLNMISRCDGLVMIPDWENSKGAVIEKDYAESLNIPIWFYPDVPDIHTTEKRSPVQSQAFREIVGKMYRVHLDKNADYSPANIAGPGELGLATRIWDKCTRLMNLLGFKIDVTRSEHVDVAKTPKNEPLEDTYMDLAVYGIIGLLFRQGKWGR